MCGIAGWLSTAPGEPVSEEILNRMRDSMVHRGPDGAGTWVSPARQVGLAHRRLAIVDLNANANQPMPNEDGNRADRVQRRDLQPPCARASSKARGIDSGRTTPTPKRSCTATRSGARTSSIPGRHVRIRDLGRAREDALLARDRIGVKPLYFTVNAAGIALRVGDQGAARASPRGGARSSRARCTTISSS